MRYQVFGTVPEHTRQFVPFVQGARSQFTNNEIFFCYARIASFCCIWIPLARAITFQVTANSVFVSFRDKMCLLNSVAFLLL